MALDKSALFAPRFETREYEIPGVGTIVIRALSRQEIMTVDHSRPMLEVEQVMVAAAMVDPAMTAADVAVWQANSPADELSAIIALINDMSGIKSTSNKEAYKSV